MAQDFFAEVEKVFTGDQFVKYGRILVAEYESEGKTHTGIYFRDKDGGEYYTPAGESLRRAFLKSPLEFTRISSGYSRGRRHPILGGVRSQVNRDPQGRQPPREKTARIPRDAKPLPNPVGTAPGVWFEEGGTTFVALPGAPSQMTAILETSVLPALASRAPGAVYVERAITTQTRDESVVVPVPRRIARDVPGVFLKSRPTHFGADVPLQVFASTWAGDRIAGEERMARALTLVREALGEAPTEI